jgi:hypothetical protein
MEVSLGDVVADVSYYSGNSCDSRGNYSRGDGLVNYTMVYVLVNSL